MGRNKVQASPAQILPTLIHIQTHLDADLSLEHLAAHAAVSPYHFHRLFRATTGETLKRYTQRLRLERAAFELKISAGSILDVALNSGFRSHETFSRAFRRQFGMTPISYRQTAGRLLAEEDIGRRENLNQRANGYSVSSVRIQRLAPLPLAFIRHLGRYESVDTTLYDRLVTWAKANGMYTGGNLLIGIGHDDPGITPTEKVRFDACIEIYGEVEPAGDIAFQTLPTGLYASVTYVGPYGAIVPEAYSKIFQAVSLKRGFRMLGLPAIEIYRTTRINPDYQLNETDVFLPVVPVPTLA